LEVSVKFFALLSVLLVNLPAHAGSAKTVTCPDRTKRPTLECSTDVGLKQKVKQANVKLGQIPLAVGGRYKEQASGQITDSTYQFALKLESLCKEYNACLISPDQYRTESRALRNTIDKHLDLMNGYSGGRQDSAQLWANARQETLGQQLQMTYRVDAILAATARTVMHHSGEVLGAGDRVAFQVSLNQPAHLYILLLPSQGTPVLLYPDPRTGRSNPLQGGASIRIPANGAFVLDNVPGTETLQLIAAQRPLQDLESRLQALTGGQPAGTSVTQSISSTLCGGPSATRGMSLETTPADCPTDSIRGMSFDPSPTGQEISAVPGDDVIVVGHSIVHK
jgi:hypothetical protein